MKRNSLVLTLVLMLLGLLVGDSYADARRTKVGVIISQTGPLAMIGKGIVNGVVLADEQNDPDDIVRFIYEDDGLQPARAVAAAEKLIAEEKVSALITFAGGSSSALAPLVEKKQIPLITIAAGDQYTIGKTFVYRQFLSTDAQVGLILGEKERQTLTRIAIVTTAHETLTRLRNILREGAGAQVVADEEILPSESDMRSIVTRINSKHPDAVVLYLLPPQLAIFSEAISAQGFKGKFFGTIQIYNFPQVVASKGTLIGTIFPAIGIKSADSKFHRDYRQRFSEPLASEQEIFGYDIATTLIEVCQHGDIQDYLTGLKATSGLAGSYPRRENNFFEVPAVLKRVASERCCRAGSVISGA